MHLFCETCRGFLRPDFRKEASGRAVMSTAGAAEEQMLLRKLAYQTHQPIESLGSHQDFQHYMCIPQARSNSDYLQQRCHTALSMRFNRFMDSSYQKDVDPRGLRSQNPDRLFRGYLLCTMCPVLCMESSPSHLLFHSAECLRTWKRMNLNESLQQAE